MTSCQVGGQMGIANWLSHGPYHEWKVQGYKCVSGTYVPKNAA